MATTDDPTAGQFDSTLSELKLQRLSALNEASGLQVALLSLLHNEAQRIENKLGPESRRTLELKASLETNFRAAHALEVERQLSRIDVPEVVENGVLVNGRIVDEDGLGIDRLTVGLVDQSGTPARDVAEPTTDSSGYFAISLEPGAVDRLLKQYSTGIFLAVFTPRRRLVYQQPNPLAVAQGAVLEVEIILDRDTLIATPSTQPTTIATPNLIGLTESEGLATLQKFGLKLGERKTRVAPDQAGIVLDQSPAAGTKVAPESSVSLVIGVKSETIPVPSVIGQSLKSAKAEITKSDLVLGKISGASPSDESIVREQDPKPDTKVQAGTQVNVTVTVASPAGFDVKDIVDRMTTDEAFGEIGISITKLEKRIKKHVETREQLASLLESPESDLKSSFALPTLNAARALKRVLQKVLEET